MTQAQHAQREWKNTASIDKERPGIIRFSDGDAFDGALVGCRAAEVVSRYNAAPDLLEALENLLATTELNLDELESSTAKAITEACAAIAKSKGEPC